MLSLKNLKIRLISVLRETVHFYLLQLVFCWDLLRCYFRKENLVLTETPYRNDIKSALEQNCEKWTLRSFIWTTDLCHNDNVSEDPINIHCVTWNPALLLVHTLKYCNGVQCIYIISITCVILKSNVLLPL